MEAVNRFNNTAMVSESVLLTTIYIMFGNIAIMMTEIPGGLWYANSNF